MANNDIRVMWNDAPGVHVSVGPLHSEVGDVSQAQNASFFGSNARGGLSTRGGMTLFATGAAGAILSILSVTFPDLVVDTLLVDADGAVLTDDTYVALLEG